MRGLGPACRAADRADRIRGESVRTEFGEGYGLPMKGIMLPAIQPYSDRTPAGLE